MWRLFPSVVTACGLLCGNLHAAADNQRAAERFDEAVKLVDEGAYEKAIEAFEEAYALRPHPVVLYNLALAYAAAERFKDAAWTLAAYLEQTVEEIDAPERRKLEGLLSGYREHLVKVTLEGAPEQSTIRVDGNVREGRKRSFWLDPGQHEIVVEAEGFVPRTLTVDLIRGRPQRLRADTTPLGASSTLVLSCQMPDVTLAANSDVLGTTSSGSTHYSFALRPGPQAIRLSRPGYEPQELQLDLAPQQTHALECRLSPRAADPALGRSTRDASVDAGGMPTSSAVLGLTGVMLGAGATGLYLYNTERFERWQDTRDRLDMIDDPNENERREMEENSELEGSIKAWDAVTWGMAGASVVSLGAAIWIWAANDGAEGKAARTAQPQLHIGVTPAGMRLQGTF